MIPRIWYPDLSDNKCPICGAVYATCPHGIAEVEKFIASKQTIPASNNQEGNNDDEESNSGGDRGE